MEAARQPLPGGRWHWQHGPIDIVAGAEGDPAAVHAAHEAAWARFQVVLRELVAELPLLKLPVEAVGGCPLQGPVARRMWHACAPHAAVFITPMAAVAGAVAEELVAFYRREGITRAWVNNGGDIALHLTASERFRVGLFADLDQWPRALATAGLAVDGVFDITHDSPVRGVATSGWKGRSFSLGIADSVTVLAATAAQADAAATLIGNAVDVAHPGIVRRPANTLRDDSDLGAIEVTVDVPALTPAQAQLALAAGRARALDLQHAGLIVSCVITCQGQATSTDDAAGRFVFLDGAPASDALQETETA